MRLLCTLALAVWLFSACSPTQRNLVENLPPGDAERGRSLFTQTINGAPACSACHSLDGTALVGPGLQDYAANARTRITGVSPEAYSLTSIIQPGAFVVSGYGNVMYNQYAQRLTPQQIADLIAYLLTL